MAAEANPGGVNGYPQWTDWVGRAVSERRHDRVHRIQQIGGMMNEIHCTVIGNVVTDVRAATTRTGHHVASFRMVATTRRVNRETNRWEDVDSSFLTISCWRQLADHVVQSIAKGDPVVVVGRLRVREYVDAQGRSSISVEVEAASVGHDLTRGRSRFERVRRDIGDGGDGSVTAAPSGSAEEDAAGAVAVDGEAA